MSLGKKYFGIFTCKQGPESPDTRRNLTVYKIFTFRTSAECFMYVSFISCVQRGWWRSVFFGVQFFMVCFYKDAKTLSVFRVLFLSKFELIVILTYFTTDIFYQIFNIFYEKLLHLFSTVVDMCDFWRQKMRKNIYLHRKVSRWSVSR